MADDREIPDRGYTTQDLKAVNDAERPRKKRHWWLWIVGLLVIFPVIAFTLWTLTTLKYTYSTGDRVGYVQKFSKKGFICKTWEGQLAMSTVPGSAPQYFDFTVRDDSVAQSIRKIMETQDGRVALTYAQHKKVPLSCFGETEYFVTSARPVGPGGATGTVTYPTGTPATPGTPAAPVPAGPAR
jgi:hypothetical protein